MSFFASFASCFFSLSLHRPLSFSIKPHRVMYTLRRAYKPAKLWLQYQRHIFYTSRTRIRVSSMNYSPVHRAHAEITRRASAYHHRWITRCLFYFLFTVRVIIGNIHLRKIVQITALSDNEWRVSSRYFHAIKLYYIGHSWSELLISCVCTFLQTIIIRYKWYVYVRINVKDNLTDTEIQATPKHFRN